MCFQFAILVAILACNFSMQFQFALTQPRLVNIYDHIYAGGLG
jgi:hypothetical protein